MPRLTQALPMPILDERVYDCELVPSRHEWLRFLDTIQFAGDEDEMKTIRKNYIVVRIANDTLVTVEKLKQIKCKCKISFPIHRIRVVFNEGMNVKSLCP